MEATSDDSAENADNERHGEETHSEDSGKDLEARVCNSDSEAHGSKPSYRTEKEYYSAGKEGKGKNISKSNLKADARHTGEKVERTFHGTALVIEKVNPETGEVEEYLFELRTYDNKDALQRGKYGLMGGGLEKIEGVLEDSLENIIKEIREEVEDPRAAEILIKRLEYIDTITDMVEGESAHTYVYRARIRSPEEWHIISSSRSADGAGPRYRIKARDFRDNSIKPSDFMYSQGDFMFDYAAKRGIKVAKPKIHDSHSAYSLLEFRPVNLSQAINPNFNVQNNANSPIYYNLGEFAELKIGGLKSGVLNPTIFNNNPNPVAYLSPNIPSGLYKAA